MDIGLEGFRKVLDFFNPHCHGSGKGDQIRQVAGSLRLY